MAPRPHDGSEPDESPGEPDDPGRPDPLGPPEPDALPDPEIEERWAEIVTRLGPAYGGVPSGVVVPDDDVPDDVVPDEAVVPDDDAVSRPDPIAADPRGWVAPELDEHFEPPEPGPVFGGDPLLTMAWIAVVGPLVLLVVSVVAWRDIPSIALRIAGVAFLVGLGVLFWRMPASRDEDDGPGAVV